MSPGRAEAHAEDARSALTRRSARSYLRPDIAPSHRACAVDSRESTSVPSHLSSAAPLLSAEPTGLKPTHTCFRRARDPGPERHNGSIQDAHDRARERNRAVHRSIVTITAVGIGVLGYDVTPHAVLASSRSRTERARTKGAVSAPCGPKSRRSATPWRRGSARRRSSSGGARSTARSSTASNGSRTGGLGRETGEGDRMPIVRIPILESTLLGRNPHWRRVSAAGSTSRKQRRPSASGSSSGTVIHPGTAVVGAIAGGYDRGAVDRCIHC